MFHANRRMPLLMLLTLIVALVIVIAIGERYTVSETSGDGALLGVELPIIMYHSVLDDAQRGGKYIITPDQLEKDLLYLREHGYTTILMQDLIAYMDGEALPEKPILLTFDDAYYNNYSYLFPLLKKYDMKAVISVIGIYTELYSATNDPPNNNYSHLTWAQLREMQDSGLIEVQNHTYNMHGEEGRNGLRKKTHETEEQYDAAISEDIARLQELCRQELGTVPTLFVYPFGYVYDRSERAVRALGFSGSVTCYERVNLITRDPETLYCMGRYNRAYGKNATEFFANISVR